MKSKENARARAVFIIGKWETGHLPLSRILDEEQQKNPFKKSEDNQLCRALVYGVVRWKGYLDKVLSQYSKHPLAKMKDDTRDSLRVALYQVLFMDRIPVSAAINEAVNILRKEGHPRWLTGFVNGLLRNIDRQSQKLPVAGGDEGFAPYVLHSYPEWLYSRWRSRYGKERSAAICRAGNRPAPLCLRAKDRDFLLEELNAAGIKAVRGQYSPQAVILPDYRGGVESLAGYDEGRFQVQDEAAQLASLVVGISSSGRYLDGCAGLGGKTTHLAEMMPEGSTLKAVEPDKRRRDLLHQNLARLGLVSRVRVFGGKLQELKETDEEDFDTIFVDAPCSGTGVIRHHPDIRWNKDSEDLIRYQEIQLSLLDCAASMLVPGGVIVYATCSTEPEENEMVVEKFLAEHPGFIIEDCREFLPDEATDLIDENGFFHPLPDQEIDGFFAARLKKNQ